MAGGIPDRDLEEGEELEDIDEDIVQVLSALARSRRSDNERRLSRELEEGFIDDSSDSDSD